MAPCPSFVGHSHELQKASIPRNPEEELKKQDQTRLKNYKSDPKKDTKPKSCQDSIDVLTLRNIGPWSDFLRTVDSIIETEMEIASLDGVTAETVERKTR